MTHGITTTDHMFSVRAIPAKGFKANVREDTGAVLGIVSANYEVVDNRDAFRFLDALIGSDMHFETAGSLWGGRRVWVLARVVDEDLGKAARANRERTIGRVLDVFSGRGSAGDATGDSQRGSRGG